MYPHHGMSDALKLIRRRVRFSLFLSLLGRQTVICISLTSVRKGLKDQIANMQEKTLLNGLLKTPFSFVLRRIFSLFLPRLMHLFSCFQSSHVNCKGLSHTSDHGYSFLLHIDTFLEYWPQRRNASCELSLKPVHT